MPVLDADLSEPAPPGSLVCSRWLAPASFSLCAASDFEPPEIFETVVDGATDLLYTASGRQYPGICSDTIRPVTRSTLWAPEWSTPREWGVPWFDPFNVRDQSAFLAPVQNGVWLPGFPVVDVTDVTIEGVPLSADHWLIVDDRWLVRRDGVAWPSFQRTDRPAGGPQTWTVSYTFGTGPPSAGLLALQVLVCELGLGWKGDKACRLPKRLTQVTREGFSAVILDPFKFLDQGKFGVYEIDVFVNSTNPHHLSRDGKVLNVDLLANMPRRVR